MFRITQGKGFQMTFANGWTASVQFGPANYCEKRAMMPKDWDAPSKVDFWESKDAEVAAWDANGTWFNFEYDTVDGWKSCDDVARFLLNVSAMPEVAPKQIVEGNE